MTQIIIPAVWLIVLIAGLPQLSETVYTPSLPEIAKSLGISHAMAEYTLTIYLFGFSIGNFFWGFVSDRIGRKPCILLGLIIFMLGSLGCYLSTSIQMLMMSRFVQAFGGSIGSVLGQSICRDVFHGAALSKAYAALGSSIAIFPAIGPVIGGFIAQYAGWSNIFLFLIAFALVLMAIVILRLPETHHASNRRPVSVLRLMKKMGRDKKVLGLGFLVAASNGISFSYFAEGSFYLIKLLGLTASEFGMTFIAISLSTMFGGFVSRYLLNYYESPTVMNYGIASICIASGLFSVLIMTHMFIVPMTKESLIIITIAAQMMNMFGKCIIGGNSLALALTRYRWCIGAASSLFGFYYYCLTSLFTFGMGKLHNHTLLPMPLYFFAIGLSMIFVRYLVKSELVTE